MQTDDGGDLGRVDLDVRFAGSLVGSGHYTTQGEILRGSLRGLTGLETQVAGQGVRLNGAGQGIGFVPTAPLTFPEDAAVVVELAFSLEAPTTQAFTTLLKSPSFVVGFDPDDLWVGPSSEARIGLPGAGPVSPGARHTLSLKLRRSGERLNVAAWLDGVTLGPVAWPWQGQADSSRWVFGNGGAGDSGFHGILHRVRIAEGGAPFALQATSGTRRADVGLPDNAGLPGDEGADDLCGLEPGNYVDVRPTDSPSTILKKAALLRPTPAQALWQEEGLTAFIHFGINTFYGQEWGNGTEVPAAFDPVEVDAEGWVKTLRETGFRTVILTLKHHDGFALWPTRYSRHSVAASPWADGKGDIARDLTDAARRLGVKVGFYLSPADSNAELNGLFGNGSPRKPRRIPTLVPEDDRTGSDLPRFEYEATDYGALFLNTLYEILTQYGKVHEVWFDGAQGNTAAGESYDYAAFYDLIHRLQPDANIAVGGRDIRWVGNELGVAREDEWATVAIIDGGEGAIRPVEDDHFAQDTGSDQQLVRAVRSGRANRLHWWPTESDMKITSGWFAHADDEPKTAAELLTHYEDTYGRNSVMLLNVPPTVNGRFSDEVTGALEEFARERRKAFTLDHALGVRVRVDGASVANLTDGDPRHGPTVADGAPSSFELDLGEPRSVARIGLSEAILRSGQNVRGFVVEADLDGWGEVGRGGVVGAHRIVKLARPVAARRWRIRVTSARGAYTLSSINLWEQLDLDPASEP
ncbi:Alpha-L-fucosidase [Tessaracoccus bendigoensis DSM 12906]|uniref:alpha-L-fucosidase n=1 Tax=Tessaracoccus bendigoensis DSM 12906 TaxID=1123357 RepID=A0A1M6M7B2_9ACTN|nr:alpha-L-fucosidase [Tessaracoccus bendigoensis]SHJ79280.1 Alpha-L-fucosidase [Tessaracoccus bendigoensis DSM 12906]